MLLQDQTIAVGCIHLPIEIRAWPVKSSLWGAVKIPSPSPRPSPSYSLVFALVPTSPTPAPPPPPPPPPPASPPAPPLARASALSLHGGITLHIFSILPPPSFCPSSLSSLSLSLSLWKWTTRAIPLVRQTRLPPSSPLIRRRDMMTPTWMLRSMAPVFTPRMNSPSRHTHSRRLHCFHQLPLLFILLLLLLL